MGVRKKTKSQGIKRRRQTSTYESEGEQGGNQALEVKQRIWQVVAMIPKGQVATYGQIAKLIGLPSHARYVGTTLRQLPKDSKLPWHRVINSSMRISQRGGGEARQRRLLEAEQVSFIGDRVAKGHRWEADG